MISPSIDMDPIEMEPASNISIDVFASFVPVIVGVLVPTVSPSSGLVMNGARAVVSSVNVTGALRGEGLPTASSASAIIV